jgi:histidine triad (HIT) family protein
MPSIFTKIIRGEIPSYKVAEDDKFIAFLDVFPLKKGHVLVVPKEEIDYIFDQSDETLSGLMVFAKKVAKAIEKAISCKRIGIAVIGLEVPHTHIHLIPMDRVSDLNFANPKLKLEPGEMNHIAESIRKHIGLE